MVIDFCQKPNDSSFYTNETNSGSEECFLSIWYVFVGKFGHPFKKNTAYDKGDIDAYDTDKQVDALLSINHVHESHFILYLLVLIFNFLINMEQRPYKICKI